MGAARAVGGQGDQTTKRDEWDELTAAVEELRIEAQLGDELIGIGVEFHQDGVERLRYPELDGPNGGRLLQGAKVFCCGRQICIPVRKRCNRREHMHLLLFSASVFEPVRCSWS